LKTTLKLLYNIGVKQIKTITQKVAYNENFITKIKNGQRNEVQRSSKITSFGGSIDKNFLKLNCEVSNGDLRYYINYCIKY